MAEDNQQTPQNIDEDQFFSKYRPNQTEDEFFGKYDPLKAHQNQYFQNGPYHGPASDSYFSGSSVGRILSAFGQGFHDNWGANNGSAIQDEMKWEAENKDKDHSIVYGLHTSWGRPLAAAIDAVSKPVFGVMGGVSEGLGQTSEELGSAAQTVEDHAKLNGPNLTIDTPWQQVNLNPQAILSGPLRYGQEVLRGAASGAIPEELPKTPDYIHQINDARAKGIIGEGEPGFFGTVKPTPEKIQARVDAARAAGYGPETVEQWLGPKTVPTTGELARQVNPDLFKEVDRLQEEKENLQLSIQQELTKARQETEKLSQQQGVPEEGIKPSPDLKKTLGGVQELQQRALETDNNLRDTIEDQRDSERRANELLESQTPEGDAFRNLVQAQAFERALKLEEMKPQIQKTYRDASELIPPKETINASREVSSESSSIPSKTPSVSQQILEAEGLRSIKESSSKLTSVRGTGKEKESSVNRQLEAENIQKGYEQNTGKDTGYKVLNHEQQGLLALDYTTAEPKAAMEVAMGDREPPEGIHPEAILVAVKRQAEQKGDIQTLQDLARTRLGREATTMGQRIGLLKYLYDTIDPTEIMKNIEDAWKARGDSEITKTMKEIQRFQEEAINRFKPDYDAFLKSIECSE